MFKNNNRFTVGGKECSSLIAKRLISAMSIASSPYTKDSLKKRIINILKCGNQSITYHKVNKGVFFCNDILCPKCRNRNNQKFYAENKNILNQRLKESTDNKFAFLTLTIKNAKCCNLGVAISSMNSAWGKVYKHFNGKKGEKKLFLGYIKRLELTVGKNRNSEQEMHPHFHLIVDLGSNSCFDDVNFFDQLESEIRQQWQKELHIDYEPQIAIKYIIDGDINEKFKKLMDFNSYISKNLHSFDVNGLDDINFLRVLEEVKWRRFKSRGGNLGKISKELKENFRKEKRCRYCKD